MTFLTSSVFDAWDALVRLMGEVSFPSSVDNPDGVAVWFGDPTLDVNEEASVTASPERVVIVSAIDTSRQEWGPIGQLARDEEFLCLIVVITAIPGQQVTAVKDRLRDLTAAVEAKLREVWADARTGVIPAEFDGYQVAQMAPVEVNPVVVPAQSGWVGRAEIVVGCKFRVGTPPTA